MKDISKIEKVLSYSLKVLYIIVFIGLFLGTIAYIDPDSGSSDLNDILIDGVEIFRSGAPVLVVLGALALVVSVIIRMRYTKDSEDKSTNPPVFKAVGVIVLAGVLWALVSSVEIPDDFSRQCPNCVIEYHAAIDVYEMPDVKAQVDAYSTSEAWVSPLNYEYVEDKEYIARILPEYSDINIHCIIIVHTPEVDRYFLEDADRDHYYIEVPEEEFLASLNQASQEDIDAFWSNIRPGVRTVMDLDTDNHDDHTDDDDHSH